MSDVINLDQVRKNKELLKKTPVDPFAKIATNEDVKDRGTYDDYMEDQRERAAEEMRREVADLKADEEATFKALEKRNRENAERIRKERLAANQSVLRSYRIKQ